MAHSHHPGHAHGSGRRRASERRGLMLALVTTSVILVAEFVGGWLSNSLALLADAGHMLSDALALLLAYLAVSFASRPADPKQDLRLAPTRDPRGAGKRRCAGGDLRIHRLGGVRAAARASDCRRSADDGRRGDRIDSQRPRAVLPVRPHSQPQPAQRLSPCARRLVVVRCRRRRWRGDACHRRLLDRPGTIGAYLGSHRRRRLAAVARVCRRAARSYASRHRIQRGGRGALGAPWRRGRARSTHLEPHIGNLRPLLPRRGQAGAAGRVRGDPGRSPTGGAGSASRSTTRPCRSNRSTTRAASRYAGRCPREAMSPDRLSSEQMERYAATCSFRGSTSRRSVASWGRELW